MAFKNRRTKAHTTTPNRLNLTRFGKATIADYFQNPPRFLKNTGNSAATGATSDINLIMSGPYTYEYSILGTQTIIVPVYDLTNGDGLDFGQDQTASDGHQVRFTPNITTPRAAYKVAGGFRAGKHSFIVAGEQQGFYMRFRFKCSDTSGLSFFSCGFYGAQAYQATLAAYNDFAVIDFNVSGTTAKVQTKTNSNGGGITTVDSTQTIADNDIVDLRVEVLGGPLTGQVRFFWGKNLTSSQLVATPTVSQSFTLRGTAAAPIVYQPGTFFLQGADLADNLFYQEFECGYLPTPAV